MTEPGLDLAVALHLRPAHRPASDAAHGGGQRCRRVLDRPRAGAARAQLAQDARQRREPVEVVDVDRPDGHGRVEDHGGRPVGEAAHVLLGHLGPVGHAEQRELVGAERDAQVLEVAGRLDGGQERALGPELVGAVAGELERRAARGAGAAGPALVDEHEVVRGAQRGELPPQLVAVAHGLLAGAAGEQDERAGARTGRREHRVLQRQRPGRRALMVERHPERPAARLLRAAAAAAGAANSASSPRASSRRRPREATRAASCQTCESPRTATSTRPASSQAGPRRGTRHRGARMRTRSARSAEHLGHANAARSQRARRGADPDLGGTARRRRSGPRSPRRSLPGPRSAAAAARRALGPRPASPRRGCAGGRPRAASRARPAVAASRARPASPRRAPGRARSARPACRALSRRRPARAAARPRRGPGAPAAPPGRPRRRGIPGRRTSVSGQMNTAW